MLEEPIITLYKPEIDDLWFKELMLSDGKTMSYNHAYGGTILFPKSKRRDWYERWIKDLDNKHFYRYLKNQNGDFVGEIAYHFDEDVNGYLVDILIYAKYRGFGYGTKGLKMLCNVAKENGINILYDNIAIDNPSVKLFLKQGFVEKYRTKDFIVVEKTI